ncbi:MAG: hypothetical protein ACFB3T_00710 [Geminicoccaceae bacterium]
MTTAGITFAPWLPWPVLAVLGVLALLLLGFGAYRKARGVLARAAFMALAWLALANPVLTREERVPLADTALVVVDRSGSMSIGERERQLEAARTELEGEIEAIDGLEMHEVVIEADQTHGSRLREALALGLSEIGIDRLAGVIVLSDGQLHDIAEGQSDLGIDAPVHHLVAGSADERDRRLIIEQAPSYAMLDEPQTLRLRVDSLPEAEGAREPIPVTVRQDGALLAQVNAQPGEPVDIPFSLERAGQSVIEIEAEVADGELTALNNRRVAFVNGVRDRLRVLLVSGKPYPGLRVWRNLLKADPAVDLVHFTILRPPEKQDGTPIRELALIAFPSRELFEVKLDEFDLVIFDRYARRGLLPLAYLDNVARFVEDGGALLEAAGPEFAYPLSLYRTPLSRVLPAVPSGRVYEEGYRPQLSDLGQRHPVTSDLQADSETWGRWFRQVDVDSDAQVLMTGVANRPLLVLDRVGEGRVAQLLSDHAWLWARGLEEGGPQARLLRRLVHWLMKEPELEEEDLLLEARGDQLLVRRRSLDQEPVRAQLHAPSGATQDVALEPGESGLAQQLVDVNETGLFRVEDGERVAYASLRPMGELEMSDLLASPARLAAAVEASEGATRWLEQGTPSVRLLSGGRSMAGRGWIGVRDNEQYRVIGTQQGPLLPPPLALVLLLATLAFAWYREGRV